MWVKNRKNIGSITIIIIMINDNLIFHSIWYFNIWGENSADAISFNCISLFFVISAHHSVNTKQVGTSSEKFQIMKNFCMYVFFTTVLWIEYYIKLQFSLIDFMPWFYDGTCSIYILLHRDSDRAANTNVWKFLPWFFYNIICRYIKCTFYNNCGNCK